MRTERSAPSGGKRIMRPDVIGRLILSSLLLLAIAASAAEAPMPITGSEAGMAPLPPEAEAAHQDLVADEERQEIWLDEAVFTEISPLTIPEVGIALPPDQEI